MHEELLHDPDLATELAQFATKPRRDRDEFSATASLIGSRPHSGVSRSYRQLGLDAIYGGLAELHPDAVVRVEDGGGDRRRPSSIVDSEWCRTRRRREWVLRCKGRHLACLPQHYTTPVFKLPWFDKHFAMYQPEPRDGWGMPIYEYPTPADWKPVGGTYDRARLQAAVRPDSSERLLWAYADARRQEHTKREPTLRERQQIHRLRLRLAAKLLEHLREPGLVRMIMQTMGGGVDWVVADRGIRANVLTTDDEGQVVYRLGNLAASLCGVGFSQHNTKDELLYLASQTMAPEDQPDPMWDKPEIARHMLTAPQ